MFSGPSTVQVFLGFTSGNIDSQVFTKHTVSLGNSQLTLIDWDRGEVEGNIDSQRSTKHTAFPRSQSISILSYTKSQRLLNMVIAVLKMSNV